MGELTQWSEHHPIGAGAIVVVALFVIWLVAVMLPDLLRYIRISRM